MDIDKVLQQNIRDINRKKKTEAKIKDLQNQLKYLHSREIKHRESMEAAQAEVDKIQGHSLANLFMASDKKTAKINKDRRKAYEAAVNYDSIISQIHAVEAELKEQQDILKSLEGCELQYEQTLQNYKNSFRDSNQVASKEILQIENKLLQYESYIKEISEAIEACGNAKEMAELVYQELQKAKNNSLWNILSGSRTKHIDTAQEMILNLQISVRHFKNEMGDVQEFMEDVPIIRTERFLKFSDYFFDDIFIESQDEFDLNAAIRKVEDIRWKLEDVEEQLNNVYSSTSQKEAILRKKLDDIAINKLF